MEKRIMPPGYEPKCSWRFCFYGMDLYRLGVCKGNGEWDDENCTNLKPVPVGGFSECELFPDYFIYPSKTKD